MRKHITTCAPYIFLISLIVVTISPIYIALQQLYFASEFTISTLSQFIEQNELLHETITFSIIQAAWSATIALFIGLPIAWLLGRYRWRAGGFFRSGFTLPFLTPSIVAAAGFLSLSSRDGLLPLVGIHLHADEGFFASIGTVLGIDNFGMVMLLICAHAWFNLSLFIRYVEPKLRTLSPDYEDQFKLLPNGDSILFRIRVFWLPYLGGAILTAWLFSFFFSFTSFALIRWLVPSLYTLESISGTFGTFAGISGYRIDASKIVLVATLVQAAFLLLLFSSMRIFQLKFSQSYATYDSRHLLQYQQPPALRHKFVMWSMLFLVMLPYITIMFSSFQVRPSLNEPPQWSLQAWKEAIFGHNETLSVIDALSNSVLYAITTISIVIPLSIAISACLLTIERRGHSRLAMLLEMLMIFPIFVSAVTIGLGISIGLISIAPGLITWRLLPAVPHIFLTLPFAIRIVHPAMRGIEVEYLQQALLLPISHLHRLWVGLGVHLKPAIFVVFSLSFAFSFGEFGASFLVIRFESWTSLSLLVDVLLSRPKYEPIAYPMAMVAASVLMIVTFLALVIIDSIQTRGGVQNE